MTVDMIKGVYKHGRRFHTSIYINGETKYLGSFESYEEAAATRREWEKIKGVKEYESKVDIDPAVKKYCEEYGLTVPQSEVIQMLMLGMSHKDMASYLGASDIAIKYRFKRIYEKIDTEDVCQIMVDIYDIAVRVEEG